MPDMNVYGDLNLKGNRTRNMADPAVSTDGATAAYVDSKVAEKVSSVNGVTGIWRGSQAEYDGLGSKSATVLYIIT